MSERQKPICLVFRQKTGCKQYPFNTVEELDQWASRHPYNKETLRFIAFRPDGQLAGMAECKASEAAKKLQICIDQMELFQ